MEKSTHLKASCAKATSKCSKHSGSCAHKCATKTKNLKKSHTCSSTCTSECSKTECISGYAKEHSCTHNCACAGECSSNSVSCENIKNDFYTCAAEGISYETTIDTYVNTAPNASFNITVDDTTYTVSLESQNK